MSLISRISEAWTKWRQPVPAQERGYRESVSAGGSNADWPMGMLTEDADCFQNAWALTSRVRDLFRTNPMYQSYRETLWANVYGSEGIMLRMRVKEQEDRVVYTPEEKAAIRAYDSRRNRIMAHVAKLQGRDFEPQTLLQESGLNGSRVATIKVGDPDVFANQLIERRWKEWQRSEFCDVRGVRNYQTMRQLRGISAVRDGDFFIRMVRKKSVNKFGFALQLINSEWCDRFYNTKLPNGNEVRMGIEYQFESWGLGKPVAYYMIKRQPRDWQFTVSGGFNFTSGGLHDRIPAEEIIHYARPVDADSTRPAPWVASTIPKARQLDQAMLAEVIAWREAACKTGWFYSDVLPEGGTVQELPDPRTGLPSKSLRPGETGALKWGVKYQERNPTHPNANAGEFQKAAKRDMTAGMPGANYSTLANDYEAINFSAGRLQRLDSNELFKLIQNFDIDYAENPIFEAWLEMGLLSGAIALPMVKFDKFNSKIFSGRRWQGVDPVKDNTASALAVANKFSSRSRECADRGVDFEEILFELAEEEMMIEQFGLNPETTVENPANPTPDTPVDDSLPGNPPPTSKSRLLLP